MRMFWSGTHGLRFVPMSSLTVSTVIGMSWPMPTAPVDETTSFCQPDSSQVVALRRSGGTS